MARAVTLDEFGEGFPQGEFHELPQSDEVQPGRTVLDASVTGIPGSRKSVAKEPMGQGTEDFSERLGCRKAAC